MTPSHPGNVVRRACAACSEPTTDEDDERELLGIQPRLELGAVDDPLEREAERNAERVVDEATATEPEVEEEDEDEDVVRTRRTNSGGASNEPPPGFAERLGAAEHGGSPLPATIRSTMEQAFGRDFGRVRIHADSAASTLAASVGALAFTRGSHVFFGAQTFQPNTRAGMHLLAHELTHVVQQRGSPAAPIMRRPGGASKKPLHRIGYFHLYDENDKSFATVKFFDTEISGQRIEIPDGVYWVKIEGDRLVFPDAEDLSNITLTEYPAKEMAKAARIRLQIITSAPGAKASGVPKAPDKEGVYGEFDQQGKLMLPPDANVESLDLPTKPPQTGGDKQAETTGPRKNASGSKYGWLGLLELPESWISALEAALEAMGGSEEYLGIKDTIRSLGELYDHRGALVEAFSSGEKLVEVMLGLDDNSAFDRLGDWARSAPKDEKLGRVKDTRLKGALAVASKVVRLLQKVRRIVKPVFATRNKLMGVFDGVTGMLGDLGAIEELMDAGSDFGELASAKTQELIMRASSELATKLDAGVRGAVANLELWLEKIADSDFVAYKELAQAITRAALQFVPYPYKLGTKAAEKLGLDTAIADNLVAEIIPSEMLGAINDSLRSAVQLLEPAIKDALAGIGEVVAGLGEELTRELPGQFQAAFAQASVRPGASRPPASSLDRAERSMRTSVGAPLSSLVREDFEGRLGFEFGRVRVHTDAAAAAATDHLGVDAFTVGSHLYFAPGRFQPGSTEGRRLLAHELTHVEQQRDAPDVDLIQADWKSLRRRLVAKLGTKVRTALTMSRSGSKQDLERAARVREWVDAHLHKQVTERDFTNNLDVRAAYTLVRRGKKTSVRRTLRYLGLVPGVTLDRKKAKGSSLGTLELGIVANLEAFDPNNRARAALRRSLNGCAKGEQAHHIVPLELQDHPLIKLAIKSGEWSMNDGNDNGVCLSTHSGPHPVYTARIEQKLNNILETTGYDWPKARPKLRALVVENRRWCKNQKEIK